ncbi:MAG: hypothetical protein LZF86_190509 [Nitrospira sp.]|nr:MAG: hypothetical protein LZF86_190509 [Nitrospira sp.]
MAACIRCDGLLVRERLFEASGIRAAERVDCQRCLNCGAVEDTVILANGHAARMTVRTRKPRGPRSHSSSSFALEAIFTQTTPPRAFGQPLQEVFDETTSNSSLQ